MIDVSVIITLRSTTMPLAQWISACTNPASSRLEGLCARMGDAVDANHDTTEKFEPNNPDHVNFWKDLTMAVCEPTIPREISIPNGNAVEPRAIGAMDEEYESLIGLHILDDVEDFPREAPEAGANCSWTYSTASTHGKDIFDFLLLDDGFTVSSSSFERSKPPRPAPPTSKRLHHVYEAAPKGLVVKASTFTRRDSRKGYF